MIHHVDTFPGGCIGPALFLFGRHFDDTEKNMQDDSVDDDDDDDQVDFHVKIMVHPSIFNSVETMIVTLVKSFKQQQKSEYETNANEKSYTLLPSRIPGGLALLRVRGVNSTYAITQILLHTNGSANLLPSKKEKSAEDENADDMSNLFVLKKHTNAHCILDHGTIIPSTLSEKAIQLENGCSLPTPITEDHDHSHVHVRR
eukprot:3036059-Ditylum_brightwellii.AAC.1